MGKYETREQTILNLMNERDSVSILDVVQVLNISESTARRMFQRMSDEGKALRIHGGLRRISSGSLSEYSFDEFRQKKISEKQRIGKFAASLIESGDTIFLDGGTTVLQLAGELRERIITNELHHIVVITSSLVILNALDTYCKVLLVGGEYRPRRKDFSGLIAERIIKTLQFKKCFVGADGVDIDEGFMVTDIETASLNEMIISRSEQVYALVDSDKFLEKSFISYSKLKRATLIITDTNLEEAKQQRLQELDIRFVVI